MDNCSISLASILTAKNEYLKSTSSSAQINYNDMIFSYDSYRIIDDAGFYIKYKAVYDDIVFESSDDEAIPVTLHLNNNIENNRLYIYDTFDSELSVKKIKKLMTPSHITNQNIGFSSEKKNTTQIPSLKEFLKLLSVHHPKAALYIIFGSYATGDIDQCSVHVNPVKNQKNQYEFEAEFQVSRSIASLNLEVVYDLQMHPDMDGGIYSYSHINSPDISKLVIIVPLIAIIIIVLIVIIANTGDKSDENTNLGTYPVSIYVNFEGEKYQQLFFFDYVLYIDDISYGELEIDSTNYITLDLEAGEHTVYLSHNGIKSKKYTIDVTSSTDKVIFEAKVGVFAPKLKILS